VAKATPSSALAVKQLCCQCGPSLHQITHFAGQSSQKMFVAIAPVFVPRNFITSLCIVFSALPCQDTNY
jgi:hypothetical protein